MNNKLIGTGVALVTPFNSNKEVDYEALSKLIDHVTNGGVDYLVALGTTAETPTLSREEKCEIVKFIKSNNTKNLPIVLGIGGNSTYDVIKSMGDYDITGIEAILSVTPYYNKPSQAGIFEHYKAIAKESPLPVMLYNVPGRTGVNMTAETTLKIAHNIENIIGIKEAAGIMSQANYILRDRPSDFMFISGDDNMALPLIASGGEGVISVAANCYTETFCRMIKYCIAGDFTNAAALQMTLVEAVDALFEEGNPTGAKAALAIKGVVANELRLPLVPASEKLLSKIATHIAKYNL